MAGAAFSNSMVGIVHAIGHALGGVCHVPHGDAMSVLLPVCMAYNLDTCGKIMGSSSFTLEATSSMPPPPGKSGQKNPFPLSGKCAWS